MNDILTNAIRPLFELPDESKGTMMGTVRMLNDPLYRNWAIRQCSEQTVWDFWHREFAKWTQGDQAHNVNSSLNKIRRFQSAPVLRRILGQQRSRIDFGRAIADGQILILNLDKWAIGIDNANTLASLIVSRLIYEATHRPFPKLGGQVAMDLVIPFHIYIDEFHSVTSLAMVEALSGIRKYRVGFTLCHQYTDQLSKPVLDAIKGNVGTKIAFRIGGTDAEALHRSLDVTEPKHLTELPDYDCYVAMKEGNCTATYRAFTLEPDFQRYGYQASILSRVNTKYAQPVSEVEEQYQRWLKSRHYGGAGEATKPAKKKMRPQAEKRPVVRKSSGGFSSLGSIMVG